MGMAGKKEALGKDFTIECTDAGDKTMVTHNKTAVSAGFIAGNGWQVQGLDASVIDAELAHGMGYTPTGWSRFVKAFYQHHGVLIPSAWAPRDPAGQP